MLPRSLRYSVMRGDAVAYLWVALGGALGAMGRYGLAGWINARYGPGPLGIFIVNVSGAFLIGFVMALTDEHVSVSPDVRRFLTVGILGGYTTFSTWMYETHQLAEAGDITRAILNIGGSLLAGLLAVCLGVIVGRAV